MLSNWYRNKLTQKLLTFNASSRKPAYFRLLYVCLIFVYIDVHNEYQQMGLVFFVNFLLNPTPPPYNNSESVSALYGWQAQCNVVHLNILQEIIKMQWSEVVPSKY